MDHVPLSSLPTWAACLALIAAGAHLLPLSLQAQALQGVVRDSAMGSPLAGVEILLRGAARTTTGPDGRYLVRLDPGVHTLVFRRIGYGPASLRVTAWSPDTLEFDLNLTASAQELPELTAEGTFEPVWLGGFEERRRTGQGAFLTEDLLRASEHRELQDLIRGQSSGARFRPLGTRTVAVSGRSRTWCPMAIWVDGVRVFAPGSEETSPLRTRPPDPNAPTAPPDFRQWKVHDFQAVEVYTAAQTPARFQATGSSCGTILLWSRIR